MKNSSTRHCRSFVWQLKVTQLVEVCLGSYTNRKFITILTKVPIRLYLRNFSLHLSVQCLDILEPGHGPRDLKHLLTSNVRILALWTKPNIWALKFVDVCPWLGPPVYVAAFRWAASPSKDAQQFPVDVWRKSQLKRSEVQILGRSRTRWMYLEITLSACINLLILVIIFESRFTGASRGCVSAYTHTSHCWTQPPTS